MLGSTCWGRHVGVERALLKACTRPEEDAGMELGPGLAVSLSTSWCRSSSTRPTWVQHVESCIWVTRVLPTLAAERSKWTHAV